ncbi:hypothetical protein FKM82_013442 [Ascaphus truei]
MFFVFHALLHVLCVFAQMQYRIGQLYMISKHSHEQSSDGEGVEVSINEPYEDPVHGKGQYTEKRLYLNSQVFGEKPTPQEDLCFLDIAFDDIPEGYYKKTEDLRIFHSEKTGRGPLMENWRDISQPIMCSYKLVATKFEVYGFQSRVESFVHKNIKDILLAGHRQAVAWMDEWFGMSLEDVRRFEKKLQEETNGKVNSQKTPADSKSETLLNISSGKHSINRSTSWNNGSESGSYAATNGCADVKQRPRLPSAPE